MSRQITGTLIDGEGSPLGSGSLLFLSLSSTAPDKPGNQSVTATVTAGAYDITLESGLYEVRLTIGSTTTILGDAVVTDGAALDVITLIESTFTPDSLVQDLIADVATNAANIATNSANIATNAANIAAFEANWERDAVNGEIYPATLTDKVGIGTASPTARAHIKGEGNTTATAAMLVENSDGTTLLKANDDGTLSIAGDPNRYEFDWRGTGAMRFGWSDKVGYVGYKSGDNNLYLANNGVETTYITTAGGLNTGAIAAASIGIASSNIKIEHTGLNARYRAYYNAEYQCDWNNVSSVQYHFWTNGADEHMRLDASGRLGIGTASPSAMLDVNSDVVRLRTSKTPSSASDTGNTGDICWDSDYVYVCVATNTWKRSAISTW